MTNTAPQILNPGAPGPPPQIIKPGTNRPLLRPTAFIQRPNLCVAAEDFADRLSEKGDLVYDWVRSTRVLLRMAEGRYRPLQIPPNLHRDDHRYTGMGADGTSACKAGYYCGELDATDRETMHRLTGQSGGLILPGSVFQSLPPSRMQETEFHILELKSNLLLPNVERSLYSHRGSPALRQIERTFKIDAVQAAKDPTDCSFAKGFGRALCKQQKGLTYTSVRALPGEFGAGFQNVLFFGAPGTEVSILDCRGTVRYDPRGPVGRGFAALMKVPPRPHGA